MSPAVPLFTKSRRFTLCAIALLSSILGTSTLAEPAPARPQEHEGRGRGEGGTPFAVEADARPGEARGARPGRPEPRDEERHRLRPRKIGFGETAGQELGLAPYGG